MSFGKVIMSKSPSVVVYQSGASASIWFDLVSKEMCVAFEYCDDIAEIKKNVDIIFWCVEPFDFLEFRALSSLCHNIVWFLSNDVIRNPKYGNSCSIPLTPIIIDSDPEEVKDIVRLFFPTLFHS